MIIGILVTILVAIIGAFLAVYFALRFAEESVVADILGDKTWHNLYFAAIILTFISYLIVVGICAVYFFI